MPTDAPGHSKATAHLRFGQREGVNPIPQPLQLGELSRELRSLLWDVAYESLTKSMARPHTGGASWFGDPWGKILKRWHVSVLYNPVDEFTPKCQAHIDPLKHIFFSGTYIELFDFLEFVLQSRNCPHRFAESLTGALERARAAYIVVDDSVIFPTATVEEAKAFTNAFEALEGDFFAGARSHLLKAGEELNKGDYAASVRESIHAVESVSRAIVPGAKALAPALAALEERAQLHGALKKGFSALYGFTCDEQGIRHPLLDQNEAEVDRESAVFMLGACASFLSYLVSKGRQAGLIA